MRYQILNNEGITIIHVIEQNILFGYNDASEYYEFIIELERKGIDTFVDLLIEDSNTAFTKFINNG
jgi:hypothetical protein